MEIDGDMIQLSMPLILEWEVPSVCGMLGYGFLHLLELEKHHPRLTVSDYSCIMILFLTLVMHSEDKLKVTEPEMKRWIGIMFAMTISPVPNLVDFRKEENDGFMTAQRFGAKLNMGKTRFKFIRKHFKTGAICTAISAHLGLLSGC